MDKEGIKTDFIIKKIERFEKSIQSGGLNKSLALELIQNLKEYNIQSVKVIEDCETEIFYLKYLLEKRQNDIDHLAKLLECSGVTRIEMALCTDESIDYLWQNADKKNIENIHSISCLLKLASEDGRIINTPKELKQYIENGTN